MKILLQAGDTSLLVQQKIKLTNLYFSGQPTKAKEPTKEEQMKMLIDQVKEMLVFLQQEYNFSAPTTTKIVLSVFLTQSTRE